MYMNINDLKVLIACEESQRITTRFREKGVECYSCDLLKCSGGHPEWHINQDVIPLLKGDCYFKTMDNQQHYVKKWNLIIAHPPCTYLTNTGARWFDVERYGEKAIQRYKFQQEAIEFFMTFVAANSEYIAIENPVGIMSTKYRKPDCIYNPYDFKFETECKRTCLWLKGLPPLVPNQILPVEQRTHNGFKAIFDGKQYAWNDKEVSRLRSVTPQGVANAMVEQWLPILLL